MASQDISPGCVLNLPVNDACEFMEEKELQLVELCLHITTAMYVIYIVG